MFALPLMVTSVPSQLPSTETLPETRMLSPITFPAILLLPLITTSFPLRLP